jgi:hypothetical protein
MYSSSPMPLAVFRSKLTTWLFDAWFRPALFRLHGWLW